jgi:hypothetical protein
MKKLAVIGLATLCSILVPLSCEAKPVGTDRYTVEFTGKEGQRFQGAVYWSGPGGRDAKQYNQQINRQLPLAFEIDLPHGSSLMAEGNVDRDDLILVKIFMNGFRCDDTKNEIPSDQAWKTCLSQ